jgi:hypothetical protein
MLHENQYCPTFLACYNNIISSFSKSKDYIKEEITRILKNKLGKTIPGFGEFVLKKERIGLKAYRIGKSGGLRFIYLFLKEKIRLIPIYLYKKGEHKKEHNVTKEITANLKKILEELKSNGCTNILP